MIPIVSNTMEYSFSHAGNRKAVRPLLPSVVANECSCDLKSSLPNELLSERYIKKSVWRSINIMPCFVAHTKDGESFLEYPNQIHVTRDDIAMLPELIRPENIVRGAKSNKKTTPDGFSLYYEEVRTKRKQLAFKTMYKVKK